MSNPQPADAIREVFLSGRVSNVRCTYCGERLSVKEVLSGHTLHPRICTQWADGQSVWPADDRPAS